MVSYTVNFDISNNIAVCVYKNSYSSSPWAFESHTITDLIGLFFLQGKFTNQSCCIVSLFSIKMHFPNVLFPLLHSILATLNMYGDNISMTCILKNYGYLKILIVIERLRRPQNTKNGGATLNFSYFSRLCNLRFGVNLKINNIQIIYEAN